MAVFPESMNKLDPEDTRGSFATIESYIRYMGERMEFAMRNMTKTVSEAGVSSAEMYILLTALQNDLSALKSTVNGMSGSITSLSSQVGEMQSSVQTMQGNVTAVETSVSTLQGTVNTMQNSVSTLDGKVTAAENSISSLDARVTALESAGTT